MKVSAAKYSGLGTWDLGSHNCNIDFFGKCMKVRNLDLQGRGFGRQGLGLCFQCPYHLWSPCRCFGQRNETHCDCGYMAAGALGHEVPLRQRLPRWRRWQLCLLEHWRRVTWGCLHDACVSSRASAFSSCAREIWSTSPRMRLVV